MKILLCAALLAASFPVLTDTRADGHAPIGVMGDHLHKKGSYMLSYRFMRMSMAGNRDGPQLETDWTATVGWQYAF